MTPPPTPPPAYAAIRERAVRLAGEPGDIAQRAVLHYSIYLDSGGGHAFPLVALHGALWAYRFFETTGRLGQILRARYFYDRGERERRMAMLDGFAEGFKAVNREVFVDTYANYHFTKAHGREPGAEGIIHPELLDILNALHADRAAGRKLSAEQRRQLYQQALLREQETTVGPRVREEVERFDCPILRTLCLKPLVRFSYFPRAKYMVFRDFSDVQERIAFATLSYDLAEQAGWRRVAEAVRHYGVLSEAFFRAPAEYADHLVASLVG
ncbi:MAG TPA: hypothetical protein VFI96_06160 [Longimicrobiaceae bacterium]|nr:hypothetical protein [Longimicrobiaceae bacterium]